MKAPYAVAVLVALGLAGCKTEVSTTPTGSTSPAGLPQSIRVVWGSASPDPFSDPPHAPTASAIDAFAKIKTTRRAVNREGRRATSPTTAAAIITRKMKWPWKYPSPKCFLSNDAAPP